MARKSKKRKIKTCQKIGKFLSILWIIISLVFFILLLQIHILPSKYVMILLGIYAAITLIVLILMLTPTIHLKAKIGGEIFSTCFLIILLLGCFYLYKTIDFMGNIKDKKYQIENYYVVVLNDSGFQTIQELNGKKIGIYTNTLDTYEESLKRLQAEIMYQNKQYQDILNMWKDLLNKNIDEAIDVKKESFNLYISGIDIYGNIASVSRSDVNIIITVNPIAHKILLTSIPRDYYVQLHGTTGCRDKLTHAGIYGVDMSISTIEDLLGIDINYYARVNFTTLENLVDAIDGIDVYSDYDFTTIHGNYEYHKGINHLNGKEALSFSRERYAFADGDRQRGKNQQAVITAIINKALSSKTMITKYTNILNLLQDSFQTNMSSDKIYDLVHMQLDQMPSWSIESISLDGTGKSEYTYSYSGGKLYVMEPDLDTVINAQNKIPNDGRKNDKYHFKNDIFLYWLLVTTKTDISICYSIIGDVYEKKFGNYCCLYRNWFFNGAIYV